ncbi:reverse transcriptase domain-containing protein, partial [Tanacetum coccineum]
KEMKRLEATGEYTEDEINALARGGKLRGHIPGVRRVLPSRATSRPSMSAPDKLLKSMHRKVDFMMSLFRNNSKYSDMFNEFESGGASGSGGCGDVEESSDDEDDDGGSCAKNMDVINDIKALLKSTMVMDKEVKYMNTVSYSSAVGSLMYALVCTRPDLAHAVSVVSRFMANRGKAHWKAVKWILRYLKGVSNICLVYDGKGHGNGLIGYADSDYGGDMVKRRSLTCFIFTLFECAISWKSTLRPTIALSTTEAEYMSMTEGIKECIWLHGLVQSLGLNVVKPVKETTKRGTEEPLAVGEIPSQGGYCVRKVLVTIPKMIVKLNYFANLLVESNYLQKLSLSDHHEQKKKNLGGASKHDKYMAKCAAIEYGFLLFSFTSLGELEVDAVTLLKRIWKFSMAQDIGARAPVHIFNRISFTIVKGEYLKELGECKTEENYTRFLHSAIHSERDSHVHHALEMIITNINSNEGKRGELYYQLGNGLYRIGDGESAKKALEDCLKARNLLVNVELILRADEPKNKISKSTLPKHMAVTGGLALGVTCGCLSKSKLLKHVDVAGGLALGVACTMILSWEKLDEFAGGIKKAGELGESIEKMIGKDSYPTAGLFIEPEEVIYGQDSSRYESHQKIKRRQRLLVLIVLSLTDKCHLDYAMARIEVDRAKIDVIAKFPYPTNVKGVRSFLEHVGFYRSDFAVGSVLGQRIDGKFKPIYYASKTLNNAKEHYTTTEKELLAVVLYFDKFRPYLIISKVVVYTHHSALKYLFSKQNAKPRLIRLCPDNVMRRCIVGNEILEILEHCHGIIVCRLPEEKTMNRDSFRQVCDVFDIWGLDFMGPFTNSRERSVGYKLKNWSEKLDDALWAFRTGYKTPTGCTPFRLVYGKACHLPMEIEHKAYWALKQCNMDLTVAAKNRFMELNELIELKDGAYENTRIYKERTKRLHDSRNRGDKDFKCGDKVLLFNFRFKMHPGKLKSRCTSVWFDKWNQHGPLSKLITMKDIYDARFIENGTIADLIDEGRWLWPTKSYSKFPPLKNFDVPTLKETHDQAVWINNNGEVKKNFYKRGLKKHQDTISFDALDSYYMVFPMHSKTHFYHVKLKCKNNIKSVTKKVSIAVVVYNIWRERNLKTFQQKKRDEDTIIKIVKDDVKWKLASLKVKKSSAITKVFGEWGFVSTMLNWHKRYRLQFSSRLCTTATICFRCMSIRECSTSGTLTKIRCSKRCSCGQSSKRWTLCNTGVLSTPKAGTAETPNAGVLYGPKAVVLETPKPGALDPKGELETSWLPAPKVDEPNALLLEAGCDCANELPKGPDVKSKLPNAGFCANMDDLPKGDDEAASNAVLEVAPGCLIAVIKWVSDHPFGISNSGLKNVMSNKPNLNVSSCTVSENRSTRVWILAYAGFFGGLRFIFLHIMMGVWITAYTSLQVLRT